MPEPAYPPTTKKIATQLGIYLNPPTMPSGGNMRRLLDGMTGTEHSSCLTALLGERAAMLLFSHRVTKRIISVSNSSVRAATRIG
jgi:hypothetical protein